MIRFFVRLLKTLALLVAGGAVARRLRRSSGDAPSERASASAPAAAGSDGASEESTRRFAWKRRLVTIGGFLAVAGAGGLLVAASGLVPLKASSGHWAITRAFLHWGMERSVSTHSMPIDAPSRDSLASPLLVLKGAGHYRTGCQPCHGDPSLHRPRVAAAMTPHPPYLPPRIADWDADELFYIVKHGIKPTGMPAWPSSGPRDDEVWAVVAFLLAYPEMDEGEYRHLVHAAPAAPSDDAASAPLQNMTVPPAAPADARMAEAERLSALACARCHGTDGRGRGRGAFPKLAGQTAVYLRNSLQAYADSARHSGMMEPIAADLSEDEIQALAAYFEEQGAQAAPATARAVPATQRVPTSLLARGEVIALRGVPSDGIPSCADCHGPGEERRNPAYPLLAGQYAEYLALQLELFKEEHRGGSPYVQLMHPTAHRLTPEQIRAVSLYYASLGGGAGVGDGDAAEAGAR